MHFNGANIFVDTPEEETSAISPAWSEIRNLCSWTPSLPANLFEIAFFATEQES